MKKNILIGVETALIVLAVISMIGLYQDNKSKESTIQDNKTEIKDLKYNVTLQDNANNTTDIAEKTKFINSGFACYLNYNEDNYHSRFKDVDNYFSPDVIDKLSGAGSTEKPSVPIKSSARNYVTYVNPAEPNSFVHVTDIFYQVADNEPTTFKNVYVIHLSERDNEYIIDKVDVFSGIPTNK
ncbi:MAG: hypothetical protein KC455_08625 [Carnobacterium sp.]|nr:hypothetical protein [Carnobacterium sp.]